ncbi:MAG: hypothetical protein OXI43_10040 [Candidatus Poribacteria bacterium]|nr:hypothetical protein [Candidatus Poribacteria bacterium]
MPSKAKIPITLRIVVKKPPGKIRNLIYSLAKVVARKLSGEAIELIWEFLKNLLCLKSTTAPTLKATHHGKKPVPTRRKQSKIR